VVVPTTDIAAANAIVPERARTLLDVRFSILIKKLIVDGRDTQNGENLTSQVAQLTSTRVRSNQKMPRFLFVSAVGFLLTADAMLTYN
jgi:hypothetical protein